MKSLTDLMNEHPFFSDLPNPIVQLLAGCGANVVFTAGSFVHREGEPADRFLLLRHGTVALEIYSPKAGPQRFQTLGPGDLLGVSWLVPPYAWRYDARALTEVRAVAFDAVCLREKCATNPAVGYAFMVAFVPILVERLHAARLQSMNIFAGVL